MSSFYKGPCAGHDCGRRSSEEIIPGGRGTAKMAEKFENQPMLFILNLIVALVWKD